MQFIPLIQPHLFRPQSRKIAINIQKGILLLHALRSTHLSLKVHGGPTVHLGRTSVRKTITTSETRNQFKIAMKY